MFVLDIVHLARRGWWLRRLGRGRWNARRPVRGHASGWARRQRTEVALSGGIALHQLDYANHQQNGGPGSVKLDAGHAVEQEEHAERHQNCRTHQLAGAASFTAADSGTSADESPVLGKEPHSKSD